MSGRPKNHATDQEERMRALTREANAAVKDLRDAIRDARQMADQLIPEVERKVFETGVREWEAQQAAIQKAMDHLTDQLRHRVVTAREDILRALVPAKLERTSTGFEVKFTGPNFDPGPELLPLGEGQRPDAVIDLRRRKDPDDEQPA